MNDYLVLITTNNLEIIGKVVSVTEGVIILEQPVTLPDVYHLEMAADYPFYNKDRKITFYQTALVATYRPSDLIVQFYMNYLTHPNYTRIREHIDKMVADQIEYQKKAPIITDEMVDEVLSMVRNSRDDEDDDDLPTIPVDDIIAETRKKLNKKNLH